MKPRTRKPRAKSFPPKRRNTVVQAMMSRSAKAGPHGDRRKAESRRACRGRVRQ